MQNCKCSVLVLYCRPAFRLVIESCIFVERFILNAGKFILYAISAANSRLDVYCPGVKDSVLRVKSNFFKLMTCKYVIQCAALVPSGELVYIGADTTCSSKP